MFTLDWLQRVPTKCTVISTFLSYFSRLPFIYARSRCVPLDPGTDPVVSLLLRYTPGMGTFPLEYIPYRDTRLFIKTSQLTDDAPHPMRQGSDTTVSLSSEALNWWRCSQPYTAVLINSSPAISFDACNCAYADKVLVEVSWACIQSMQEVPVTTAGPRGFPFGHCPLT